MKKYIFIAAFLFLALAPQIVLAVNFNNPISPQDQATFDQILVPVLKVYNLVKYTATVIAVMVLLFAGVNYMLSGSDPKKRESAKSMAMYVVLGLIIIWAAPLVVQFILG